MSKNKLTPRNYHDKKPNKFFKIFQKTYVAFCLLFLYVPLFILMIFAFNNNGDIFNFGNFKFGFYYFKLVFTDSTISYSILTTIIIGIFSTIISTIIGTLAALSLSRIKSKIGKIALTINDIPIINADIVTAFSLLLVFLSISLPFGFFSMLMAHVSFCIPYVVVTVMARIIFIDESVIEASLDLGASPLTTLRKVVLPIIMPSIFIGAALSFAMSFDDFIVSYFTGGSTQNISVYLYGLKHFTPVVCAFSVFLIIILSVLFIIFNIFSERKYKQLQIRKKIAKIDQSIAIYSSSAITASSFHFSKFSTHKEAKKEIKKSKALLNLEKQKQNLEKKLFIEDETILKKDMLKSLAKFNLKKILFSLFGIATIVSITGYYIYLNLNSLTIAIYGSYIDSDTIRSFEKKYNKHLNIVNYDSSEQLFVKRETTNFAITMPSEYLVQKLLTSNYVEPINYKLLKSKMNNNLPKIIDGIQTLLDKEIITDKEGNKYPLSKYILPYYWGSLAWVSNNKGKTAVLQTNEWSDIWRALKAGKKILFSDDARNTFTVAMQLLLHQAKYHNLAGFPKLSDFDKATDVNNYDNGLNPNNPIVIKVATTLWKWILTNFKHQISFLGDDIQNLLINGNFDYALCYNSDLSYAYLSSLKGGVSTFDSKYIINYFENSKTDPGPLFANNIWIDGFTISPNLSGKTKDTAYDFLAYIYNNERAKHIALWSGGASAIIDVYNYLLEQYSFATHPVEFKALSGPIQNYNPHNPITFLSGYLLYIMKFEEQYANGYNEILASL